MDNNNIDKLFKEQLKTLMVTPNKKVWENIEGKLKKKKRRSLPILWFSSGIAALFLLGIFLFSYSNDAVQNKKTDSKQIITTKIKKSIKSIEKIEDSLFLKNKRNENILVADKSKIRRKNKIKLEKKTVRDKNPEKKRKKDQLTFAENTLEKNKLITSFFTLKRDSVEDKRIKKRSEKFKKVDLNQYLKTKDSVLIKISTKNKWSVTPVFAVLNSNSFSNRSPIDEKLTSSTKGENTLSYGLKVAYKINNKWSIQSGIHLQEIRFTNNRILVSVADESLNAFNNGSLFSFNENSNNNFDAFGNSTLTVLSLNGNLSQNYGYLEIPLEVKYKFISSSKVNSQIVIGFSSLFLNKNEINLSTESFTNTVHANNLNNINFSSNIGFDVNFVLSEKWSLNLNPMFKTQLNTFNGNSNGFSPFNIGFYSGIKYQF
jgi:hypothetical protein